MAKHYLHKLFRPTSIAVFGASARENSIGRKVFKNLIDANFNGKLLAINPKHKNVFHHPCFASLDNIKDTIDLAIIITPANTIPNIIAACGKKGIDVAIIISSGFSEMGKDGHAFEKHIFNIAAGYHIRLVGPNCLGIMRTHIHLNATYDRNFSLPGNLAFVSQSSAFSAAILDWCVDKKIGFSTLLALGNSVDVDFADILDFLTTDPETQTILLHIEKIHHARRFMSALRAAARMKPVIVIKTRRQSQNVMGNDNVFDIALHRAGAVRVKTIEELFIAAKILSSNHRVKGNRLSIVTNGGSLGVIAADAAMEHDIALTHHPLDILGDATPERYRETLQRCIQDENTDGILTILAPTAMSEPTDVAEEVIAVSQKTQKPVLAAFVGGAHVKPAKDLFTQYQALHYDMPEKAVKSFSYLASFQSNQQLLLQVPEPFSLEPKPNIMLAKSVTEKALAENRAALTPNECKTILQAFGIPVTQAKQMFSNLRDRELMIGVTRDPIFGPVISLGAGGTLVELMKDRVYTLPPLNSFIARQLIQQTHITKLSDIDMDKILNILLRVSEMICEMPMIKEIEMNPLIIKKNSAEVFDVKIIIDEKFKPIQRYSHMAIHPYPNQLMTHHNISENFSIMIRPIKPEDAIITQAFMRDLSPHSKYFRFMQHIRELTPAMLVRLTQIDYDREMTFIATIDENGKEIAIGLAHYVTNPDRESSEFAIVIADAWQNKGIGSKLMNALTQEAKAQHLSVMMGFVIATNTSMLELTKRLGFVVSNSDDPTVKIVTRYL